MYIIDKSWRRGPQCDCKTDWQWVRSPLEEMKYFNFFALVSRQSAALSSATQHAMPPESGRKWGTSVLTLKFPLPTLLCAGYSVGLKFFLRTKQVYSLFIYVSCIKKYLRILIRVRPAVSGSVIVLGSTLSFATQYVLCEFRRTQKTQYVDFSLYHTIYCKNFKAKQYINKERFKDVDQRLNVMESVNSKQQLVFLRSN